MLTIINANISFLLINVLLLSKGCNELLDKQVGCWRGPVAYPHRSVGVHWYLRLLQQFVANVVFSNPFLASLFFSGKELKGYTPSHDSGNS